MLVDNCYLLEVVNVYSSSAWKFGNWLQCG